MRMRLMRPRRSLLRRMRPSRRRNRTRVRHAQTRWSSPWCSIKARQGPYRSSIARPNLRPSLPSKAKDGSSSFIEGSGFGGSSQQSCGSLSEVEVASPRSTGRWSGSCCNQALRHRIEAMLRQSGRNTRWRSLNNYFAKKNRMSAIPSAKEKPYPKVSTGVTFFPHLRITAPTDDKTSPAMIGLTNRLMP
jgi:hypothetical protein